MKAGALESRPVRWMEEKGSFGARAQPALRRARRVAVRFRCTLLPLALLFGLAGAAHHAAAAEESARALLDEVRQLGRTTRHWDDRHQMLDLTIVDRRGGERTRSLEMWTKRYDDEATKTLLFFREPAQARGIGFLQWLDPHGADRQWFYQPSAKRTRQITSSRKRESFVGTDFSYEDIGLMIDALNWSEADAASELIGEDNIDGQTCAIIALRPHANQDVSYSVVRVWIGRVDRALHRMEFEDEKGKIAKALSLSELRDVGGVPVAHTLVMKSMSGGSYTTARVREVVFNRGIGDDMFTERRLERGA